MLVTVLKPFPYAADGKNIRELEAGAREEIVDDCVAGLIVEGYVTLQDQRAAPETKVIDAAPEVGAPVDLDDGSRPGDNPSTQETAEAYVDEANGVLTGDGSGEPLPEIAADPYPQLSPAQEEALDRVNDGAVKPGGAPKGGNRKSKARG